MGWQYQERGGKVDSKVSEDDISLIVRSIILVFEYVPDLHVVHWWKRVQILITVH